MAMATHPQMRDEYSQAHRVGSEHDGTMKVSPSSKPATGDGMRNQPSLKARKRTKTGCLTCRKRRIKCGEERPTCSNCVKSKRNCEGYTPRVIFKDPLNAFRPSMGTPHEHGAPFQTVADQDVAVAQYPHLHAVSGNQMPLPAIAPRPSPHHDQMGLDPTAGVEGHGIPGDLYHPYGHGYGYDGQQYGHPNAPPPTRPTYSPHRAWDGHDSAPDADQLARYLAASNAHNPVRNHHVFGGEGGVDGGDLGPISGPHPDWSHPAYADFGGLGGTPPADAESRPQTRDTSPPMYLKKEHLTGSDRWDHSSRNGPESTNAAYLSRHAVLDSATATTHQRLPHEHSDRYHDHYAFQCSRNAFSTIDEREDDYWDVDTDEENMAATGRMASATPSDVGLMLALSANQSDRGIRSLHNFLNEPNVLSTYHPVYTASPLMDPQTARVFCHFVTATAPTLSLCERHPANPSIIFSGNPVPISQRSLWTYTLPMLALSHQGLLHAMLALASLHIAKLQQTSPTPSLKHYHYALRRVAKALSQPRRRKDVATLAATLLLGFYEVTTAEHNKWNSHLAGARQLVSDIDFVGMGKRIAAHKSRTQMDDQNRLYHDFNNSYEHPYKGREFVKGPSMRKDYEIDENLVSAIMGWEVKYNQHGQVLESDEPSPSYDQPLTSKEMENFDIQCDLFWWYCKHDMYQSMVSGNRLLLSYDRWSDCPPRAPLGKLDAAFGTMDHLVLLVSRIADFAGKDVKRKIRVAEMNSMKGKTSQIYSAASSYPTQQHGMSPTSNHPDSQTKTSDTSRGPSPQQMQQQQQQQQQQPSPMYGMMPSTGPLRLPAGFDPEPEENRQCSPPDQELEALTVEMEAEWNSICHALDTFEQAFGPDYQPLSPDHMQPLSTPFGPALYYRSYAISCIWTLFYTARILAMRVRPSMPPAAMVAAGIAAPLTAGWANTIGRICAGIQPINNTSPLNPTHGAALMDSCMGLFHAGVQYRDAAQRGWTITKLRDIARLTGWQTSALIASGCERSWMKAAEMGRGPPYQRTMNVAAKDDRVAGRSRDPIAKMYPPKDNNDRRFITVNPGTRVYWALGILSAEEDMKNMSLTA